MRQNAVNKSIGTGQPLIIKRPAEMRQWSLQGKKSGKSIALVPTMGYFHEGHLSLMRMARAIADSVAVSIFVNPTQFAPNEDLDKYPKDIKRDIGLAASIGIDCIFLPDNDAMYEKGFQTWVQVEELSQGLCGKSRPHHFRGVATVVLKLFNIIMPDIAVFGQKDYQQLKIIERMVKDLNLPVKIVPHPIVREPDGLAMSSRNSYLSPQERKSALCLINSLKIAQKSFNEGIVHPDTIRAKMRHEILANKNAKIDYIFIGDADTLKETDTIGDGTLIALAVWIGTTRLIDNIII